MSNSTGLAGRELDALVRLGRCLAGTALSAGFEAVLEPLPGTAPDERTPGGRAAATTDPQPVPMVMARYVDWLKTLPWPRMFAACPTALEGPWVDYYLRRFTRYGVRQGHHEDDTVFAGGGLCIKSYAA
jgi:hypothetical protein